METLGNGLLYGIFLYEKYGVDSMRRTIVNMLYSQICLIYIFSNIFAFPFVICGFCMHEFNGKHNIESNILSISIIGVENWFTNHLNVFTVRAWLEPAGWKCYQIDDNIFQYLILPKTINRSSKCCCNIHTVLIFKAEMGKFLFFENW